MNHHNCSQKDQCSSCTCGLCCTKINNFGVILGKTEILKNVNLHIHCGDFTAIIGPNGAGKSTLLKAMIGDIPHSGELLFLDAKNQHTNHPIIGYVPQKMDFDSGSPISVQDLFSAVHERIPVWFKHRADSKKRAMDSLKKVQAEQLINKRLGVLSGGEFQRVLLALALDPVPDILLLDEPVSGIDQNGLKMFYHIVSELRKSYDLSVILVSHDLPLVAEYSDRVVFINNRTVELNDTAEKVFTNKKVIELFGVNWTEEIAHKRGEGIND